MSLAELHSAQVPPCLSLYQPTHRRYPENQQDQIRFGVWNDTWWNKPASSPTDKLFPIPETALSSNFNLKQNDGY
mgnify:CR=1 FL=1